MFASEDSIRALPGVFALSLGGSFSHTCCFLRMIGCSC